MVGTVDNRPTQVGVDYPSAHRPRGEASPDRAGFHRRQHGRWCVRGPMLPVRWLRSVFGDVSGATWQCCSSTCRRSTAISRSSSPTDSERDPGVTTPQLAAAVGSEPRAAIGLCKTPSHRRGAGNISWRRLPDGSRCKCSGEGVGHSGRRPLSHRTVCAIRTAARADSRWEPALGPPATPGCPIFVLTLRPLLPRRGQ